MIGAVVPTGACLPELRSEDENRQQKEDARDLEPENAPYAAKRAQKAANSLGNAATGAADGLPCGSSLPCNRCVPCGRCRWARELPASGTAGNANSNAQCAANGLRFHSVYDGNSDPLFGASAQLPIAAFWHRK